MVADSPVEPLKHSGVGIASFVLFGVGFVAIVGLFTYAGVLETSTQGGIDESSAVAVIIGWLAILLIGMLLVGVILGAIGLFQSNRRRIFAVLGLVFNLLVLMMTAGIIWLGMQMG